MQVLNSPSREEVNAAHFKGSWLGIGVSSVRNVAHVSKFKTWSWVVLLLSSIPIHLLFNSSIFQTDHEESLFHLTIASEDFVNGATFYSPGASLFPACFPPRGFGTLGCIDYGDIYYEILPLRDVLATYGKKSSNPAKNITIAATNGHRWTKIDAQQCKQEYITCSGLKNHRDLILIADIPGGWIRDGMYGIFCRVLFDTALLGVIHRLTDK